MDLYLNGHRVILDEKIGGGLEAEVFRVLVNGQLRAAKAFLAANHPSFNGKPNAVSLQEAAYRRLQEQQRKLPLFPTNLPQGIIRPIDLLRDARDVIVGYTMELLPAGSEGARLFADHAFRDERGITNADIVPLLLDLHRIIRESHAAGSILGDALSGNNVQFDGKKAWIIDGDSIETPGFPNKTHTREFIDPALCRRGELVMERPHSRDADWYAFNVLVAWVLTLAHPIFDGFYLPDDEMSEEERAHSGISIFHPDVELPRAAISPDRLSDDLTAHLREVFEKGKRGEFPRELLEKLVWTSCDCGNSHGRDVCNACDKPAAGNQRTRQGSVEATTLFTMPDGGTIVSAASQAGTLRYAYAVGGNIHREDGSVLSDVMTDPKAQVLVSSEHTAVFDGTDLKVYAAGGTMVHQVTDIAPGNGAVGSNSAHIYWLRPDGAVLRTDADDNPPKRLGVISGPKPMMWVGEKFGIALWREMTGRIYVFDSEEPGLNSLPLPVVPGELIDAHCIISSSIAWLVLTLQRGENTYNYCYAITRAGAILASAEAPCNDGSWLGSGIRIHAVTGKTLFTPTPAGIVRVEIEKNGGSAQFVARDPHTNSAPFVQGADRLLVGNGGIITVTSSDLTKLVNR